MALPTLPTELLHLIGVHIDTARDLNALACSSRSFHGIFNDRIYLNEIFRDGGYAILVYAAQMGHGRTIQRLIQLSTIANSIGKSHKKINLDPNGIVLDRPRSYFGWSPLSWSAVRGDEDVVKLLLEIEGIDVDLKCPRGRTALSFAIENGHVAIARLLLTAGANPNSQDDLYRTPLHWAGSPIPTQVDDERRSFRIPDWWSDRGSKFKYPVLCPVQGYFEEDIAGSFDWDKEQHGDRYITRCTEALDFNYSAPLTSISSYWSAGVEYKEVLTLLIQYGADLEIRDQKLRTPLCWAAACGYQLLVELLLDNGACSHSKVKHLRTALSWAAENGHTAIVKILIDRHVPIQPDDKHALSPLSYASMKGHYETVQLLTKKTENSLIRERWLQVWNSERGVWVEDWCPLVWAAVGGHTRIVELLLSVHAKKWPKYPIGPIAVCWAACRGHTDVIKMLLAAGAEMGTLPEKDDSMTPLQLAAKNNHLDTVKYLLETGNAEINAVDKHGWTALTWTARLPPIIDQEDEQCSGVEQILLNHGADPSFARPIRDVWSPPHFILRDRSASGCLLCDKLEWPMSFKIDWESLSQGKRMRDLPHPDHMPALSLAMLEHFKGWTYNQPAWDLESSQAGLEESFSD